MSIKQFLKEKKELIKANRRLIALGCGVSAVMVAVPSITGVVTAHNKKRKSSTILWICKTCKANIWWEWEINYSNHYW